MFYLKMLNLNLNESQYVNVTLHAKIKVTIKLPKS